MIKVVKITYKAVFDKDEGGNINIYFPSLPGCLSYSDTTENAYTMARDAMELYLDGKKFVDLPIEYADQRCNRVLHNITVNMNLQQGFLYGLNVKRI